MRRAQWTPETLEVREVEPGPLEPGWVRLQVAACGICGSDLHFWHDPSMRQLGTAPGHELVGTVVEGPAGLPDVLYAVSPNVSCGRCEYCVTGRPNLCGSGGAGIGLGRDGGLAEQVDAPLANLAPVGGDVDAVIASLAEPLAVAMRGVALGNPDPDSHVLILGAGTIGLCTALVARDRAADVAITARYPHQREAAEAMGVTVLTEAEGVAWGKEHRPDVVFETVGGSADTMTDAIRVGRRGGRIVLLGSFSEPKALDLNRLMMKELTLIPSFAYATTRRGSEFAAAAGLVGRFAGELRALATHQFPLDEVAAAFETASDKSSRAIKVTITP